MLRSFSEAAHASEAPLVRGKSSPEWQQQSTQGTCPSTVTFLGMTLATFDGQKSQKTDSSYVGQGWQKADTVD